MILLTPAEATKFGLPNLYKILMAIRPPANRSLLMHNTYLPHRVMKKERTPTRPSQWNSVLEELQSEFIVTCIVLTKDNPFQLIETVRSVLHQRPGCATPEDWLRVIRFCEVLIIDGSKKPISDSWIIDKGGPLDCDSLHYHTLRVIRENPPLGIYSAMNLGLVHARGHALIYMNSGDQFYDVYSLDKLIYARLNQKYTTGAWPRVVFGQALIIPDRKYLPSWLVPDSRVVNMSRWLRRFTPNHQTMLVDSEWARHNPFVLDSPQSADLTWIRSALNHGGSYVYLREPVARFFLGGISSKLPSIQVLLIRLNEPSRTKLEKLAEICKFLLVPFEPFYPLLMIVKSSIIGLFF